MKIITKNKKGEKRFCIYIWQEKKDNATHIYIDHIGDNELYKL